MLISWLFSFMSVVRYYLAYKTQALEAPKEWMLYLIAGVIYVAEHAFIPVWYSLAINYDMPSGATECAGKLLHSISENFMRNNNILEFFRNQLHWTTYSDSFQWCETCCFFSDWHCL